MSKISCSLDLGNGYIKGLLFLEDHDKEKSIIAKDIIKSKGIKKGKIIDTVGLIQVISNIINNLSNKVDIQIDEVLLGFSHPFMKTKKISYHKRLTNLEITEKEINGLLEAVSQEAEELNYEIIKVIPNKWIIDDIHTTKNPLGMEGRKLELIATVFMIPSQSYKDIEKIFDELEIDIIDIVPNILGGEEGSLDAEVKDLGCILIDIGTNQTSYTIYEEGNNLHYGIIPIGGDDITKDISIGLKVDFLQAEQIKKELGEIILDKNNNIPDEKIDKLFLSEIIEARLSEDIYKPIIEQLEKLGLNGKLPGGVILIGGGSKIKNIEEFTRDYFGLACKKGSIKYDEFKDLGKNLQFINAIGNYIWEEKYGNEKGGFNISINFDGFKKIIDLIKKIF